MRVVRIAFGFVIALGVACGSSSNDSSDDSQTPDAGVGDENTDDVTRPPIQDASSFDAGAIDECSGGTPGNASDSTGATATVSGDGNVRFVGTIDHELIGLSTTLTVPAKPAPSGTLFLWPGIQPLSNGANFATLDNGVLQPVLTWGPTCAPTAPASPYSAWWVSSQYVNTFIGDASPNYAAYSGCHGGTGAVVAVGDSLQMVMIKNGTHWVQTVIDAQSGATSTFDIDMLSQEQNIGEFVIEEYSSAPLGDVVFTSTTLTYASSDPAACAPTTRGTNDYFAAPVASTDGTRCCVSRIILRAAGVAATTPNGP